MLPQDPHQLRRRIMLMVVIVIFPFSCTSVSMCKPTADADVKTSCAFTVSKPLECVQTFWLGIKCPW